MAKKQAIKKLPSYKKITEDDLKILYAIKEQMIKDREENISPQQKMLVQVSDFIIDSNKDKLTATMISKALREIGVSIGTRSIKSFLLSRGYEPFKNVKNQAQKIGQISAQNQAQKIAKNEAMNELEKEAIKEDEKETQKVEIKEAQIEDEKEVSNADVNEPQKSDSKIEKIEDIKEVKKDNSVIAEDEMRKLEEEIKNIENDKSISAVRKHEKIESLKDNSIAALKRGGVAILERPQGMTKNEYMSSISRTREEAAENRTKKKNF